MHLIGPESQMLAQRNALLFETGSSDSHNMEVCSVSSHHVCMQRQLIHLLLFLKVVHDQFLLVPG